MTSRPWRGYDDLRGMQQLAIERRRLAGARATWHIGDVAWGFRMHAGRESEWQVRIWEDAGAVVAWSWLHDQGTLDHDVHPARLELLDELLDEPGATTAYAFEDDEETTAALVGRGFTHPGERMHFCVRQLAEPPSPPLLPDGFRYRTVEPADLEERVAVHRAVWAPSRVTEESFATVQSTWPYRASLDCVVEAPDRRLAAYCLVWPDDENRVGELEPVGVREEFRRGGLGASVCLFALQRLYEEGGREAVVYCSTDAACGLYASIGFRTHATLVGYRR